MKSSWVGLSIAATVLYFGVFRAAPNPVIFVDPHAIILVLGGTLAAALIAFPFKKIEDIASLIIFSVLRRKKSSLVEQAKELVRLATLRYADSPLTLSSTEKHPFMKESLFLLTKEHLDSLQLKAVLNKRSAFFKMKYLSDAKALNAIAKFPPAFGLLGASTGMIAMMANIGQGQQDKIGDAMAIALVATFWGIAIANFVLLPLADFAARIVTEDQHVRQMITEGIVLIREKEDPRVVMEKVLAYIPPHYRSQLEPLVTILIKQPQNVVDISSRSKLG